MFCKTQLMLIIDKMFKGWRIEMDIPACRQAGFFLPIGEKKIVMDSRYKCLAK